MRHQLSISYWYFIHTFCNDNNQIISTLMGSRKEEVLDQSTSSKGDLFAIWSKELGEIFIKRRFEQTKQTQPSFIPSYIIN